jgi:hypothetical protein
MNLEGIYQSDQAIINSLSVDSFSDELGFEICESWNDIKKLISINWRYYISPAKSLAELQLLVDWICSQYFFYKSLSTEDKMIIDDKIIGILNTDLEGKLNEIINNSPPLPSSLVVQTPNTLNNDELKESLITNLDPSKSFQKLKEKKLSFIQLEKGSHCLITFPILDVILPKDLRIYHIETKPINFILGDQKMELNTGFYINLIDLELIFKFKEEFNFEIYDLFSDEIKNLFFIICKWCIKNKKGNLELCKRILNS